MSSTGLRTEVPLAKVTILPCSILTQSRLSDALFIKSKISSLLNPAQDSDTARPVGRMFLSFPRACLARARNPEFRWRASGRTRILRAAATRENDRARDRARPELSL